MRNSTVLQSVGQRALQYDFDEGDNQFKFESCTAGLITLDGDALTGCLLGVGHTGKDECS